VVGVGTETDLWTEYPINHMLNYVALKTVLDPRPKLLEFYIPGPATVPYMPNKETG
jgi:hypothetical protein